MVTQSSLAQGKWEECHPLVDTKGTPEDKDWEENCFQAPKSSLLGFASWRSVSDKADTRLMHHNHATLWGENHWRYMFDYACPIIWMLVVQILHLTCTRFPHTWVVPGNDPYNLLGRFFAVVTGLQKKNIFLFDQHHRNVTIPIIMEVNNGWKWGAPKACGGISTRGCADTWKKLWSSVVGWDSMTMKNSHPDLYCKFLERIITRI